MRDTLLQLRRAHAWTATIEQQVMCKHPDTEAMYRKRCDVLAMQPSGATQVVEVAITAFPRASDSRPQLQRISQQKRANYGSRGILQVAAAADG